MATHIIERESGGRKNDTFQMKFNRNRRRSKKSGVASIEKKKEAENREKLPKSQCKYSVVIRISKLREKNMAQKEALSYQKKGGFQ